MAHEPSFTRTDSRLFGHELQLLIPTGKRRPRLGAATELGLRGAAELAIKIKRTRLQIKELKDGETELVAAFRKVWPTGLYGIDVPGLVHILSPTRTKRVPIALDLALEYIRGDTRGLATKLIIELDDQVDLRALYQQLAKLELGAAVLESIRAEWDSEALKRVVSEGRLSATDYLFAEQSTGEELRIVPYGPEGATAGTEG